MDEIKAMMIDEALSKHDEVYPVSNRKCLMDCFTQHEDELLFWYNCKQNSTHIVKKSL